MDESKRATTLRDVILSRISNLGTLAISVLVSLVILLTVVEQRLHQAQTEIDEASRVLTRAARRVHDSMHSLKKLRSRFAKYVHTQPLSSNGPLTPAAYDLFHTVFEPDFLRLKPDEQKKALDNAEEVLRKAREPVVAAPAAPGKPMEVVDLSWQQQRLSLGKDTLQDYRRRVEMIEREHASRQAAKERIRAIESKTESIPTPFGNFQINARLALLGLAIAALLSYIYFALACRAVIGLARNLVRGRDGDLIDAIAIPAPRWLYAAEASVQRFLSWDEDDEPAHRLSSALLQLFWIAIGILAAIDSWRISAARVLVFDRYGLTYLVLLFLTLTAAVVFVGTFSFETGELSASMAATLTTRRATLALLAAALIGAAVLPFARHRRKPRRERQRMPARIYASIDPKLIVNAKTHVTHHLDVCGHHLPMAKNRIGPSAQMPLHRRWEAAILYGIARGEDELIGRPSMTQDQLIGALKDAIALQPWSYHLHHHLILLYGRFKRYGEIRPLIHQSLQLAAAALAKQPGEKSIQKAKQEFERLLGAVEIRTARAGKRWAEREQEKKRASEKQLVTPSKTQPNAMPMG